MLKNNSIRLPITRPRTFLSYSFEFCGITGLNYKLLRFQSLGRDIRVYNINKNNSRKLI